MAREQQARLHIGTSGWSFDHWKGAFYPQELTRERWLEYYGSRFRAAEINNSFYQLPDDETLAHWRDATPRDFRFAAKASRYITHMKKLKDAEDTVPNFLAPISALGDKLGPILLQLPPRWRLNLERLHAFLEQLDRLAPPENTGPYAFAMEFRDPSWHCPEVCEALAEHNVAFCIYDLEGRQSPSEVTANFVYIRLHGPEGAYEGRYDRDSLRIWARAIDAWQEDGRHVYCFFDNDQAGYAAINALELQDMLK